MKTELKMSIVNVVNNTLATEVLNSNLEAICALKPRMRPETFVPAEIVKEKIPWSFPMSVFRDYKPDTEVDIHISKILISSQLSTL